MKKRIVYLILNGKIYGGSEKHTLDLLNNIPEDLYDPYLICTEDNPIANGVKDSLKPHVFPVSRSPKNFFKIAHLIRELQPDVLHLQAARGIATGRYATVFNRLFYRCKYQVISTTHGWILPHFKFVKLIEWFFKSFKSIDAVTLAVSKKSVDELVRKGFDPQKTKHIYNGIDFSKFDDTRRVRKQVQSIGFVGRLVHQKGIDSLLDALAYFAAYVTQEKSLSSIDIRDAEGESIPITPEFHIFGDGDYRPKIEDFITAHPSLNITYHGHLAAENITHAYGQIDLLIAPSIDEGLPYTFIEAMNCGIPVIATDVGGVSEIVKTGVNGWLIEPQSTHALIQSIRDALNRDISALSENAIETSKGFSLDRMVEETVACYEKMG